MLPEYTPTELSVRWQRDLERKLEAGQASSVHLGYDLQVIDHAQGLLALTLLASLRLDPSRPVAAAGGTGPLWLDALLNQPPAPYPEFTPPFQVIYSGVDPVTVMAARSLYANGARPLNKSAFLQPPADLPNAYVGELAPRVEPSPATTWSAFPLWEIDRAQVGSRWRTASSEDWLAYATIMLAVLLLLAAVVLSVTP